MLFNYCRPSITFSDPAGALFVEGYENYTVVFHNSTIWKWLKHLFLAWRLLGLLQLQWSTLLSSLNDWDNRIKIWWHTVCQYLWSLPIEQQQQDESRQVGLWDVRLLLETDENQHHHGGRDSVVQLTKWQEEDALYDLQRGLISLKHGSSVFLSTDHVPGEVGQPVEDGFDSADKLKVFGFADSLFNQKKDEAGRNKGHGKDHTDGNQNVHWCGHPERGSRKNTY